MPKWQYTHLKSENRKFIFIAKKSHILGLNFFYIFGAFWNQHKNINFLIHNVLFQELDFNTSQGYFSKFDLKCNFLKEI
jgi:hypothetical protein